MASITWQTMAPYIFIAIRVIIIACLGLFAARYAKKYILRETKSLPQEALRLGIFARFTTYIIYILTGLMIIKEVGIQTTTLMGLVGIIGVAGGLALQGSLANILSGIFLMIEHPYEVGDTITVENSKGEVIESTLYATILKTAEKTTIRIPHDKLIKSSVVIEKK